VEKERSGREAVQVTLLHIVCEGQTEETFVRDVLIPALCPPLIVDYSLIETSPGHKGGGLSYPRVQRHLRNILRESRAPITTTLFDLYRLDTGFPGYTEAAGKPLAQRLAVLNKAFHADMVSFAGCRPERFLPYFQPYEFEALLFSDISRVVGLETNWAAAETPLQAVRDSADSPEHINDGPTTKPAAHLKRHLTLPSYDKVLHGPIAASLIGFARMEQECHYFATWLASLRALSN